MADHEGYAFPRISTDEVGSLDTVPGAEGLTKRELIAAMVLQGVVSAEPPATAYVDLWTDERAAFAVAQADALLARLRAEPETEEGGDHG